MNKKYKALMLDLDGTAIPNDRKGRPSEKVKAAIAKANKVVHVGASTGRPYYFSKDIMDELHFTGPSITSGGARIVDPTTDKSLWEKFIPDNEVKEILKLLDSKGEKVFIQSKQNDGQQNLLDRSEEVKDVWSMSLPDMLPQKADELHDQLKQFSNIAVQKVVGWEEGTIWLQISHEEATKQHGIWEVAKLLGIQTHEIIGVGDGYNDFPLLMACGLKVAMGNAVPELKAIADYVAPSVDEDGVADVIEKFIL